MIDQLSDEFVAAYADWLGVSFGEAYALLEEEPLADVTDEPVQAAAWDETQHPRHPAGTREGGRFTSSDAITAWQGPVSRRHDDLSYVLGHGQNVPPERLKEVVVKALDARLQDDPDWDPEALSKAPIWMGYEKHKTSTTLSQEVVDGLVQSWAHSSSDSHLPSLLVQQAVADEFGLVFEADDLIHPSLMQGGTDVLPVFRAVRADTAAYGSIRAYVRAQYAETQEKLAQAGVEEGLLFRGMRFQNNPFPEGLSTTDFDMNPASSWSSDQTVAKAFASRRESAPATAVLAATVPRRRILTTYMTGPGSAGEFEVIVIGAGRGRRDSASVEAYQEGPIIWPGLKALA